MSKSPVYEALLDLALRGFVTLIPRKGMRIRNLTIDELKDLYEFRLILEVAGHAAATKSRILFGEV